MTNKETISIITQIKGIITNDNSWSDVAKVAVKEAFDLAIKALEEKPQGEWVISSSEFLNWECSLCHESNAFADNFCPNCGAKMIRDA